MWDAVTIMIHLTKHHLRFSVALVCRLLQQAHSLGSILWYSLAIITNSSKVNLCKRATLVGRLPQDLGSPGSVLGHYITCGVHRPEQ